MFSALIITKGMLIIMKKKFNIGVLGLSFGKFFIPVFQNHPDVASVSICDIDKNLVSEAGKECGIPVENQYDDWKKMFKDGNLDAVHVVTAMNTHFELSMGALEAGLHCACAVPMANSIDECRQIVDLVRKNNLTYMLMETTLFTREYLEVKKKVRSGDFGRIQFLRGTHIQNMGLFDWPEYWQGFPPMLYASHAVAPLFDVIEKRPESVVCFGSGKISDERTSKYGCPFSAQTAIFKMKDSDVICEAIRSMYELHRQYRESFDIYGDKLSYEYEHVTGEGAAYFVAEEAERKFVGNQVDGLPPSLVPFASIAQDSDHVDQENTSFLQGGGHGGSYPHMVHEFISAILEGRKSYIDESYSAYITAAGICAHESSMKNGERVNIPDF